MFRSGGNECQFRYQRERRRFLRGLRRRHELALGVRPRRNCVISAALTNRARNSYALASSRSISTAAIGVSSPFSPVPAPGLAPLRHRMKASPGARSDTPQRNPSAPPSSMSCRFTLAASSRPRPKRSSWRGGEMGKVRHIDWYSDEWIAGTYELTNAERGLYITACCLIYSVGGPITRDRLRAACRDHGHAFSRQLDTLI